MEEYTTIKSAKYIHQYVFYFADLLKSMGFEITKLAVSDLIAIRNGLVIELSGYQDRIRLIKVNHSSST